MKTRMALFFSILMLTWGVFFLYRFKSDNSAVSEKNHKKKTTIKILEPVINVGKVRNDTIVSASFRLANTGQNPLFINYINPDCMCTSYDYSCDTISAGDTLRVNLHVNTKDKHGEQKLVTIVKLNTEEKMHKLTLKMDVVNK